MPSSVYSSSSSSNEIETTALTNVINNLRSLNHSELLKVMKSLTSELGKKSKDMLKEVATAKNEKNTVKKEKTPKEKKSLPKHLRKPHAWVAYTLQNAMDNGWPEFVVHQRRKNKETGIMEEEEIVMPASILNSSGVWVYEGSIGSEKSPDGKQINHKEAMSLSKAMKDSNNKTWTDFESQYVDNTDDDNTDNTTTTKLDNSQKPTIVRKTAAEKEAEKVAAKAIKETEKAALKAAKEAEKETLKASKPLKNKSTKL
jgi:hypothetical protein